jgi:hypothetical protein
MSLLVACRPIPDLFVDGPDMILSAGMFPADHNFRVCAHHFLKRSQACAEMAIISTSLALRRW